MQGVDLEDSAVQDYSLRKREECVWHLANLHLWLRFNERTPDPRYLHRECMVSCLALAL